jgi:hypothetical protein
MTSPIVIVGRPRSGSRVLTQFLLENGVFMGADLDPDSLDSNSWHQRFVAPLMTSRFFADGTAPELQRLSQERLNDTWPRYCRGRVASEPWGWKVCETLFVMPIVKRLFPAARFIHVIRDARDVCLSRRGFFQLTQPSSPRNWDPASDGDGCPSFHDFCIVATFGESGVREWRGLDLRSPSGLVDHRFLIQAKSWITCVTRARAHGQALGDDYYEIRYEDLCRDPMTATQDLAAWLKVPLRRQPNVRADLVGKWQNASLSMRERRDLKNGFELAAPLLKILGYAH